MRYHTLISFLALNLFVFVTNAQNKDSLLCSNWFNSNLSNIDSNGFEFKKIYSVSPSIWAVDSFPENVVFNAQLSYINSQDTSQSYSIRIGKGGQLYSFRGIFGESVPPQWRPINWVQPSYGGGTSYAPWVDEVWQMVAVDGALNNTPDSSYFIHQAGVYLKTPSQNKPFYSPLIASYYDSTNMSFTTVNWGQQAHTEDLLNINHKSHLLYYTTYTNKGAGIIQVDNMIYNFGNDNISFLNMPWGGVRNSNLDHFFISTPTDNYNLTTGLYGQTPVVQTVNTGGWVAWSSDSTGNSPALAMAHPKTTNTNNNVFRYGDAGNLSATWNNRDYHVFEMIRFPSNGQLGFGRSMSFRYFYVLGANVDSCKNSIVNYDLINNCLDTSYTPMKYDVDSIYYLFESNNQLISATPNNYQLGEQFKTKPYLNSYPVFILRSADSIDYISSDPYYLSQMAYNGETTGLKLLGFRDSPTSMMITYDTVCSGIEYLFPDGTQIALYSDTSYVVYDLSINGEDSLSYNNIRVVNIDNSVYSSGDTLYTDFTVADTFQWLDCDNESEPIQGATNATYLPMISGSYALELTENGCVDTSACLTVMMTNIIENTFTTDFNIYPNPTDGVFFVEFNSSIENVRLKIMDASGMLLESKKHKNVDFIKHKLNQPAGIYWIELTDGKDQRTLLKLMKQ